MSDTLFADLVLSYIGHGVTLKGDVPGHEFHGNQYTEGVAGGSAGSETFGGGELSSISSSGSATTLSYGNKGHIKLSDIGNDTLKIDDVYVFNPADRGKGIGGKMYERLFQHAKDNKLRIVSGNTVENPAASIWRRAKANGYNVKIDPNAREAEGGGYWHTGHGDTPPFSIDFRSGVH